MKEAPRRIESMQELTRLIPSMVKDINADPDLALRAAANPLLAAEELGYELEPSLRTVAERRIRFSEKTANQLTELADQIYSLAGEQFDIESDADVRRVLFETLKLTDPYTGEPIKGSKQTRNKKRPTEQETRTERSVANLPITELLERLQGAHPIVEPLAKYREISASQPRLAPPELYERLRRGELQHPITRIQYRLKRGKTPR
jgi:hypothetical protein